MAGSPVKSYSADFILDGGSWCETICGDLHGDVYLTVDLDVLDPAVMPATGTPEPGGIAWRDLIRADPGGCETLPDPGLRCRGACPYSGDGRA